MAFQAVGRGFESRFPLQTIIRPLLAQRPFVAITSVMCIVSLYVVCTQEYFLSQAFLNGGQMKKLLSYHKRFRDAGIRQGWWDSEGLVAALSGGGDSVAMLWLLRRFYKGRIVAAHLDHCTREGMSHADAAFSVELCRSWEIKCVVKKVEVYKERLTGESFEMAGRRERYAHFCETAEAEKLPFIAVGHSADDVVETQLMNLFRGTGLEGLRGIPERRGIIVRPIIDFRKEELRGILRDNGVEWREDASNTDTIYRRNRVREELIPWIKENMNPNFESVMIGLSKQINSELEERERITEKFLEAAVTDMPPAIVCWSPAFIKDTGDNDLIAMLRLQGEKLGLPRLSRYRTLKLLGLIRKGGKWRFQWAGDIEICYSNRGMGWLRRADIGKGGAENRQNKLKPYLPWWARG